MPTQVERRALLRAMEFHGGAEGIARLLEASPVQVRRWSEGADPVPPQVFIKLVDLVIEHDLSELRRGSPPAGSPPEHDERLAGTAGFSKEARVRVRFRGKGGATRGAAWHPIDHPFFALTFAPRNKRELLSAALDAAMKVAGTDLGNIQLLDAAGALRIDAQHGFSRPFLDFFVRVHSGAGSACGVALREHRQVFVPDVRTDPIFAGTVSGSVILEAGVHAVASSLILVESGIAVGMLSTHFRAPISADAANLDGQLQVAERLGNWFKAEMRESG